MHINFTLSLQVLYNKYSSSLLSTPNTFSTIKIFYWIIIDEIDTVILRLHYIRRPMGSMNQLLCQRIHFSLGKKKVTVKLKYMIVASLEVQNSQKSIQTTFFYLFFLNVSNTIQKSFVAFARNKIFDTVEFMTQFL